MLKSIACSVLCLALVACSRATTFEGDAKFPQGATGCRQTCEAQGLIMGGFVYSGEYSTSCVCMVPQTAPGATAGATSASAVAVVVQAAAAAAAQQRAMMAQQQQMQMRR
jgi:hypothetical protein